MFSLRALGMKIMFFQVAFRVSGPRGPEKGQFWEVVYVSTKTMSGLKNGSITTV